MLVGWLHDYSKTSFSYIENDTGREVWVEVSEQPESFDAEPEITFEEAANDTKKPTSDLIAAGESKTVEYKQTARYNAYTGTVDKNLERAIVKSVAGFLNASGGVLLIGVHDKQEVTGLAGDYSTTGNNGRDGFENWLTTKLGTELGGPAVASFVDVEFETFDEGDVCRIDVRPSDQPVYAGESAEFFVRMGNSTRPYNTRDALAYINARW